MVVLTATVDREQVERELEQIEDQEVGVDAEVTGGQDQQEQSEQTQILGNIGRRLMAILGIIGVLLQLDTVVEILNGLFRMLEVAVLPLVALLNAFLRPIMERLLRFIGDLDVGEIFNDLESLFDEMVMNIGEAITDTVPGINEGTVGEGLSRGKRGLEWLFEPTSGEELVEDTSNLFDTIGNEFSNTALAEWFSNQGNEKRSEDTPGGP